MQHGARQNKAILARFFPSVDNLYRQRGENRTAGRKLGKNGVLFVGGCSGFCRWLGSGEILPGFAGIFGKGWLSLGDTGPFNRLRKLRKAFFNVSQNSFFIVSEKSENSLFYVSGNSGNPFNALGKFGK